MRFYTRQECEEWLRFREREKPDDKAGLCKERFKYPGDPVQWLSTAQFVANSMTFRMPALVWITESGIWRENLHLYYRLRQSYNDFRLLEDAPGHLFLEFETEDLATFLQVAILNGWGGYILTHADYVNAFFSHDGYIDFFSKSDSNLEDARRFFANCEANSKRYKRPLD